MPESMFSEERFVTAGGCVCETLQGSLDMLVIAPHPDDDVIGAGGVMALEARDGGSVVSVYVTGGGKGRTIRQREREARESLKAVGACGGIFLGCASDNLKRGETGGIDRVLRSVFTYFRPAAVYVPAPFERHATHRAATALSVGLLRALPSYRPALWGYAVWGPLGGLPSARVVDITPVADVKRKAIRCHAGQVALKPYADGMLGRNRHEGAYLETHAPAFYDYAETFLDMSMLLARPRMRLRTFARTVLSGIIYF